MGFEIVKGKLKKVAHEWHKYLEGKTLILSTCLGQWILLGIEGEKDIVNFSKFAWNVDQYIREEYLGNFQNFIKEIELGNDGFGFDFDEIEVIEEIVNTTMKIMCNREEIN